MGLPEKENLPVPSLSASFGVAELNDDETTEATIIDQADQALYVAKQQGRNCVQIYSQGSAVKADSKPTENEHSEAPQTTVHASKNTALVAEEVEGSAQSTPCAGNRCVIHSSR